MMFHDGFEVALLVFFFYRVKRNEKPVIDFVVFKQKKSFSAALSIFL